jgi:hypothetical protein
MDSSVWDTNGAVETFLIQQNQMLCRSQVLNINGLKGLDEFTTSKKGNQITLRKVFMEAKDEAKQPVFTNIKI